MQFYLFCFRFAPSRPIGNFNGIIKKKLERRCSSSSAFSSSSLCYCVFLSAARARVSCFCSVRTPPRYHRLPLNNPADLSFKKIINKREKRNTACTYGAAEGRWLIFVWGKRMRLPNGTHLIGRRRRRVCKCAACTWKRQEDSGRCYRAAYVPKLVSYEKRRMYFSETIRRGDPCLLLLPLGSSFVSYGPDEPNIRA